MEELNDKKEYIKKYQKEYQKEYYKQHSAEYKIKNKLNYQKNRKDIIAYIKEYNIFNYHRPHKEDKELIINNDLIKIEKRFITISFD
jgi:ribosomal protein S8